MAKRFVTIWFRHLKTDWLTRRQPSLHNTPFALALPDHGRMVVTAVNDVLEKEGIQAGIAVADAKAIFPGLKVYNDKPELSIKILKAFANYCIRYSPIVAIDPPDGLILDATGCSHLWGGDLLYTTKLINRLKSFGYDVKGAMADTIGTAWAITRFDATEIIIQNNQQYFALLFLPPVALRLDQDTLELLDKLGLRQIQNFIGMPRVALKRRFGNHFIERLDQALGRKEEIIHPVQEPAPYHERLPCPEFILTRTGIEIALQRLLDTLSARLQREQKGFRYASFTSYRVDGTTQKIEIGTNRATHNSKHLFKLFELKLDTIEPGLGIELFILEASKIEASQPIQNKIWSGNCDLNDIRVFEFIDRVSNRIGVNNIHRYLPDEHYWPERSIRLASSLDEKMSASWKTDKPRPIQLLSTPERIDVTAPIPDYPPMIFRYKGKLHKIKNADGPERIETEWWLEKGQHRDYYSVEDEEGNRYWLFRLGHYTSAQKPQWFIHGFFA